MKRVGNLMEAIADPGNLRLAFWKAAKGKRNTPDVRAFAAALETRLPELRCQIMAGTFPVGKFRRFTVFEPKERLVHAAAFPERVLHHALLNVCEPVLERAAIFDSYACRKGKGRIKAVERARQYARRHRWFLKMDIRKYFDSIDHRVLLELLARRFKDGDLLDWFARIVECYSTAPGKGLPIGSLTSQHFANYYLGPLDRFLQETLQCGAYVRYMDDFVVWGNGAEELKAIQRQVQMFLALALQLRLKESPFVNRTSLGMDFLGFRVFPEATRLNHRSKYRFARKCRHYEAEAAVGRIDAIELQSRVTALIAFAREADSLAFRQAFFRRSGAAADWHEPRGSRRQLEQFREQPPVRQTQQQHADEHQQQYRLPLRPSSIPTGLCEWTRRLSRPVAEDPPLANKPDPPGVSSGESVEAPGGAVWSAKGFSYE